MKRIKLTVAIIVITIIASIASMSTYALGVNSQRVMDKIKSSETINGTTYRIPENYVAQAENYFNSRTTDITAQQATEIIAKIDAAIADFKKSPTTDISKMSSTVKQSILKNGQEAVAVVDMKLNVEGGKKVVITDSQGVLVFKQDAVVKTTGSDAMPAIIATSIFGVLLLAGYSLSKVRAK